MEVLDGQGRFFGVVNVVDALVVLFVLAVGLAGVALVVGGGGGTAPDGSPELTEATHYATVEYTQQLSAGESLPQVGETLVPVEGGDNFTITETAFSTTRDGNYHAIASVAYDGAPDVAGGVASAGTQAKLRRNATTLSSHFLAVNRSTPELETSTRSVVVAVDENHTVGQALEPGATTTIGGQTVATVGSIQPDPDSPGSQAEYVGLELQVWDDGFTEWYGEQAIRVNNNVTVLTDRAVVTGRIYRIGTANTASVDSASNGT